jgi:glycosyltransferase involved in cell wall biosynthesis
VGVFHPPFHSKYFGGSVAVTVSIVNALAEYGHKVILFTSDIIDQEKIKKTFGIQISPLVRTIETSSVVAERSPLDVYQTAVRLFALNMKCDISIDTYSNYVFPWTNVCYIHFPYINTFLFKQHFPYLGKRKGCFKDALSFPYIFFEKNFQSYDRKLIFANSHFTSKAIEESLGASAKVLYPPISTTFFQKDRQILDADLREDLVITIGRIAPDKRMETILQIARMVHGKKVKFIMIGFAHDESTLRSINAQIKSFNLQGRVTVLTDITRERMMNIVGKARVYLHPLTGEHFGISIAEAMAMGCVPVVFDEGGAREFVPPEYRYKTLQEAAEKTEVALEKWTSNEARKMTEIVEQFSESNFSRNFLEQFSSFIEESREPL